MMTDRYRTTAASFSGTSITGVLDSSITAANMGENLYLSDGAEAVDGIDYDGVYYQVSVTTVDNSFAVQFTPGDEGALVITRKQRAEGRGDAAGSDVITFAAACFAGCSDASPSAVGTGTVTLNFTVYSSDGTAANLVSVA